jgi:BirA family biotin operon repressor/biotin-[acetyl-CoA-carboxylase] ligase
MYGIRQGAQIRFINAFHSSRRPKAWHETCKPSYNVTMFDAASVERRLPAGGLGLPLIFQPRVGSTQTLASELAAAGATHGTLVVADEQTEGRGRHGRRWFTPPGSGLAFSLVLRPNLSSGAAGSRQLAAWNLLGALALAEALEALGARPAIKWPNDVLLEGRKVAGVLLEVEWVEATVASLLIGIGVNVFAGAAPPGAAVDYPATSVEEALGSRPSREDLLLNIVGRIDAHCQVLDPPAIVAGVNQRLAYRGQGVQVGTGSALKQGILVAVSEEGEIVLRVEGEGDVHLSGADPHLRPLDVPRE